MVPPHVPSGLGVRALGVTFVVGLAVVVVLVIMAVVVVFRNAGAMPIACGFQNVKFGSYCCLISRSLL